MIHIYGSYKCFYCRLSRELAKSYKLKFKFYDVNELKNRLQIISYKKDGKVPKNYVSIPIIFVNSKFIGGFNEFEKILETKSLRKSKKRKSKRSRKARIKK